MKMIETQWTTDEPTKKGWYWIMYPWRKSPTVVFVSILKNGEKFVRNSNGDIGMDIIMRQNVQWLPLPLPKSPKK